MVLSQSQLTEDSSGEVLAFNPRYGFNLKRKSNETPWLLADLQMGKSRPGPKGWDDFAIFRLCISTQLYELPDLIRLPNFRVVHASMAQEGGLELCQIKFESKLTDGVLHLDPNRLWTVHHSSVRERSSDQIILARQEIELRDPTGKYPIPKRWILHKEFTNGPNVGKSASQVIEEFDVKELAEPPDDDEFTLSAFGLPEPMGMPAPAKSHTYLWIALAAGGAVALALLFRWLGLRSRKA
jgi:hypothetical protein